MVSCSVLCSFETTVTVSFVILFGKWEEDRGEEIHLIKYPGQMLFRKVKELGEEKAIKKSDTGLNSLKNELWYLVLGEAGR